MNALLVLAAAHCLTPSHLEEAKLRRRELPVIHLGGAEKLVRETHGTFAGQRTSTNFVLKWGPDWAYAADAVVQDRILQGFEDGWAGQVVRMGHPVPSGSDAYRLNVYVGNSGAPSPEIPGYAGGYATLDTEGYPMIVMHPDTLVYAATPEYAVYVDITSVHELYHTVQFATGAYEDYLVSGWYWEATAVWAETAIYPDLAEATGFMAAYALMPHMPVDFFDYPDEGKLVEFHQYAAGIVPAFIDQTVGGETLIRDSWLTAGANDDPIVRLDALLAAEGTTFDDVFMDFAARFAAYDVKHGDYIEATVPYLVQQYPGEDDRVIAELTKGTSGFENAPADTRPGPHGYNVIRMVAPREGALTIEVMAEKGSRGNEPHARAVLVRMLSGGPEYVAIDGATTVDVGDESELLLVVAMEPSVRNQSETFPYSYRMEYADVANQPGCACSTTRSSGSPLASLALLALALVLKRRA